MSVNYDVIRREHITPAVNEQTAAVRGVTVKIGVQILLVIVPGEHDDVVKLCSVDLQPAYGIGIFGIKPGVFIENVGHGDFGVLELVDIFVRRSVARVAYEVKRKQRQADEKYNERNYPYYFLQTYFHALSLYSSMP